MLRPIFILKGFFNSNTLPITMIALQCYCERLQGCYHLQLCHAHFIQSRGAVILNRTAHVCV